MIIGIVVVARGPNCNDQIVMTKIFVVNTKRATNLQWSMEINHYAKGRGSQMSVFGESRFTATRTKFIKILSLGIGWAMLINSSSIKTTVFQTIVYTLVSQLVEIVQLFITTILTSNQHITPFSLKSLYYFNLHIWLTLHLCSRIHCSSAIHSSSP